MMRDASEKVLNYRTPVALLKQQDEFIQKTFDSLGGHTER
jgi:hypothetical protein